MKLSVIIVSYENYELLRDCLDSIELYNDLGNELEVIVSDNSLTDHVYNFVKNNYPNIKILRNGNIGFGPANNQAEKVCLGEYLLFLNPDTILVEPIFKFAVSRFEEDCNLSLFGIKLIDKNRKTNNSFYLLDNYGIIRTMLFKIYHKLDLYIDGKMYIAGADLFVRKSIFEEAGRFDDKIFMYYEEPDLIKRIKKINKKYKTRFFSEKKLIHLEGATENKDIDSVAKKNQRSLNTYKYYCDKWNISFYKNVKKMRNYQYIKLLGSIILKKNDQRLLSRKMIDLYNNNLKR